MEHNNSTETHETPKYKEAFLISCRHSVFLSYIESNTGSFQSVPKAFSFKHLLGLPAQFPEILEVFFYLFY
jgi:hypothetical protein